jgi:integrase/recombinase XerD
MPGRIQLINSYLSEKLNQATKILQKYEENGIAWTFNMFEEEYRKRPKTTKVKPFILSRITELKKNERYKSAEGLTETLNLIEKYKPNFNKLYFQDIDYDFIEKFYFYLKNERKNKDTSIGIALRGLRGILNEAINQGCGSKETYPFSKIYGATKVFKISKLEKRTKKRFIPKEYLIKLAETEISEPHLNWAKQLFLFSFFGSGINFKDMAFLTEKNIQTRFTEDGKEMRFIEFFRIKTNESISIPLTNSMINILSWSKENTTNDNEFLLPIVSNPKLKGEKLINHINQRRKRLNMHLREIAKRLEFPNGLLNISSYYARHSYATTMLRNGAQIEKISEALGHTSTKTTQIYLESFGIEEIAKLNEDLLS